jgi:L-threonylcarbamoyladenylate synthase
MTNPTEILPTHTPELFAHAVRRTAELLRAGEVVALPIIVHVADLDLALACTAEWPEAAGKLAAAFWPGPLTLVLPRSERVVDAVTAGGPTVGIRWPSHPFIQAVIRECGFPLAAPSANLSNRISPTNAAHVHSQLGGQIGVIVDGGQSQVGIESTVLDVTTDPPRVLRPGMIHQESIAAALAESGGGMEGTLDQPPIPGQSPLRSPGLLEKHYAPRARLRVLHWRDEADLRAQIRNLKFEGARVHVISHSRIPSTEGLAGVSVIPHDAEAFARAIYAELHRCDEAEAELIVVETPPAAPEWAGILDRLTRAAAG